MSSAERPAVENGERINAGDIAEALTRAPFTYADEATQVFTRDGRTTYTENGGPTSGTWGSGRSGAVLVVLATDLSRRLRRLLDYGCRW